MSDQSTPEPGQVTQHIVMWSGGITSWATARIVIQRHGRENTTLLFADTNAEDEDLHRWNRDAAAQLGMNLVRVADPQERDPWQVFEDAGAAGSRRRPARAGVGVAGRIRGRAEHPRGGRAGRGATRTRRPHRTRRGGVR